MCFVPLNSVPLSIFHHHTGCFVPVKGQACIFRTEYYSEPRGHLNRPAKQTSLLV